MSRNPGLQNTETPIERQWLEEFEAASRRPLELRMRYSFIRTYKPVLDNAPYRSFDTMEEYRRRCQENLPDWLGYGPVCHPDDVIASKRAANREKDRESLPRLESFRNY